MSFGLDVIRSLEKKLGLSSGKTTMRDFSALQRVPDVDIKKAYRIICEVESNCGYAIGDSGTSFGATQVQFGAFLKQLSNDPNIQSVGLSPNKLKELSENWNKSKKDISNTDIWQRVNVNGADVRNFMKSNPNKVLKRRGDYCSL